MSHGSPLSGHYMTGIIVISLLILYEYTLSRLVNPIFIRITLFYKIGKKHGQNFSGFDGSFTSKNLLFRYLHAK